MNSPSIAADEPGAAFAEFVRVVVKTQFGGKQANLARAVGLSPGRVTRLVQGCGALSAEKCLELAAATGENQTRILTLAGKPHVAELIHLLYGKVLVADPADLRVLKKKWRKLSLDERRPVSRVIDSMLPKGRASGR